MPLMEGGVFWEHIHRLWAGGLMLMFFLGGGMAMSKWFQDRIRKVFGDETSSYGDFEAGRGGIFAPKSELEAITSTAKGLSLVAGGITDLYGNAMAKSTSAGRDKWFIGFASWPQKVTTEYEDQLTDLHADVEEQQGKRDFRRRQADLGQRSGESQPVQQAE